MEAAKEEKAAQIHLTTALFTGELVINRIMTATGVWFRQVEIFGGICVLIHLHLLCIVQEREIQYIDHHFHRLALF